MSGEDVRPADHERRMAQARKRAEWELGSPDWAGVIVSAYLWPEVDAENLDDERAQS